MTNRHPIANQLKMDVIGELECIRMPSKLCDIICAYYYDDLSLSTSTVLSKLKNNIPVSELYYWLHRIGNINPRNLSLLWRGARDGYDHEIYHELCDNFPQTLLLVQNTLGFVFGVFTDTQNNVEHNFMFRFGSVNVNPENDTIARPEIKSQVFLRSTSDGYSDYFAHAPNSGPVFGDGHDLCISADMLSNTNTSTLSTYFPYPCACDLNNLAGADRWAVQEIEVYGVSI